MTDEQMGADAQLAEQQKVIAALRKQIKALKAKEQNIVAEANNTVGKDVEGEVELITLPNGDIFRQRVKGWEGHERPDTVSGEPTPRAHATQATKDAMEAALAEFLTKAGK